MTLKDRIKENNLEDCENFILITCTGKSDIFSFFVENYYYPNAISALERAKLNIWSKYSSNEIK